MGMEEELLRLPVMDLEFRPGRSSSCILLVMGRWLTLLETELVSLSDCAEEFIEFLLTLKAQNNHRNMNKENYRLIFAPFSCSCIDSFSFKFCAVNICDELISIL
jgi:hypothetical protein